jgi:hypothetical protein
MLAAPANQNASPAFSKQIVTLFDTTEEGQPSEACLFGDDVKATAYRTRDGQRFIELSGPDGSVELHADCWAEIAKMFAGVR